MIQTPRRTYRASGNVVAIAGTAPFLAISGFAGRVIRISKIEISAPTLTAVQYLRLAVKKYSGGISGGTPVAITKVPMDSQAGAALATVSTYAGGAPTPGALVGVLSEKTVMGQASAAAAAAALDKAEFDFTKAEDYTEFPTLRTVAENIGVTFEVAPATAVTLSFTIEFTEDGN